MDTLTIEIIIKKRPNLLNQVLKALILCGLLLLISCGKGAQELAADSFTPRFIGLQAQMDIDAMCDFDTFSDDDFLACVNNKTALANEAMKNGPSYYDFDSYDRLEFEVIYELYSRVDAYSCQIDTVKSWIIFLHLAGDASCTNGHKSESVDYAPLEISYNL